MISRKNNFDLIRLLAALQVIVIHSIDHLSLGNVGEQVNTAIGSFPGVPIFFFVSGFLISQSWLRTANWQSYLINRLLRIYPALWACLALTVMLVVGIAGFEPLESRSFVAWVAAQSTCIQFFNLDSFRDIGVGVINGSLWTIAVELQFYIVMPFLMMIFFQRNRPVICFSLLAVFIGYRELFLTLRSDANYDAISKYIGVTLVPYLSLFMLGMLSQFHWTHVKKFVEQKFWHWLVVYATWVLLGRACGFGTIGNSMSAITYIPLCGFILACAFSFQNLAERVLNGNDFSYGLYLYHMPVINWVLELEISSPIARFTFVLFLSSALATASWFSIERPCLRMKRRWNSSRSVSTSSCMATT